MSSDGDDEIASGWDHVVIVPGIHQIRNGDFRPFCSTND